MKKNLLRCLFIAAFLAFLIPQQASSQITTITFNELGNGQALGKSYTNSGFIFSVNLPASSSAQIISFINLGFEGTPAISDNNLEIGGITRWTIERSNGEAFQFRSIFLQQGDPLSSSSGTIQGFKNGNPTGAAKPIQFNSAPANLKDYATDPDFYDVDEIRIEAADINFNLDHFTYGPPFSTEAPDITFEDASFVYDGTEKSIEISGTLPPGATVSYQNNTRINVGTQEATATITGDSFPTLVLTAELSITPATITGISFEDATFVFDGTEKSIEITGTLPPGTSVSYTNNSRTNVGTQQATAIIDGDNYNDLLLTAELSITAANITGITFEDASFVFDGTEKTIEISGTLPDGTSVSYTNNSRTNVGTQQATATITGDNFNSLILNAELAITPAVDELVSVEIDGAPGWRMMGAPLNGITVADLAGQNLVQGIPGLPYDGFAPNLFLYDAADETGGYVFPANGSTELTPGTGFIWFMWGPEARPDVPESKEFPLTIEATGLPINGDFSLGTLPEGWNLMANPFAGPISFNQLTNGSELLNLPGFVWNPNEGETGSYVLTSSVESNNTLAEWQGAFIELSEATEVVVPQSAATTGGEFLRDGSGENEAPLAGQIEFMLEGFGDGTATALTRDRSAILYFHEQALNDWDSWDASKLSPLSNAWATVSFLGERNEQPVLKAQHSLPFELVKSYEIPLNIQAQHISGSFRLSWPVISNLPDNAEFILLDTFTGQQHNLSHSGHVDFTLEGSNNGESNTPALFSQPEVKTMALEKGVQRFMIIITPTPTHTGSESELPSGLALLQNYPNPFNPTTNITYVLPQAEQVRLEVFDLTGRLMSTLVNEQVSAGTHTITFDAQHLASGVYIYRLQAGGMVISRKLTLIK
ncbi:MAG: T9SS type A sorting domain-containing protein [Balneolia bacterium]|nr:T9SS type A sorting domain-containing protein [Balneolia bacterium]